MATTSMNIRMDSEVNIPFELKAEIPNEETIAAIEEVRQMKQNPSMGKRYHDVDEMMEDLLRGMQRMSC